MGKDCTRYSKYALEKGTKLKIVYNQQQSLTTVHGESPIKVVFGDLIDINNEFIIIQFDNSVDKLFINLKHVVTFSEVNSRVK